MAAPTCAKRLPQRIRAARELLGLTQRAFAEDFCGLKECTLARIEAGRHSPRPATLRRLELGLAAADRRAAGETA